ncbi:DnaB-like helicase C-terminal domain-containing protein [Desulfosporosinus hippei]|uniref:Replicative DNA helicase n=1 Tax=Desulfosporosinus hippei DSM 8344 TaxID=1121419 RepID=A0A1G8CCM7_9FIRM|nr:DnaB-like helicase C-terminal domain-containing protein [Desulfosporosinus hippei]SDH43261.1 replicative DNA helicase [Desulfosporosinus hippei DSM 8344]
MNTEQNELLDKAKEQINLVEYAKSVLPSHQFKRVGKSTFIEDCPVCKGHNHFSIYTDKNFYNSFASCCKGGSVVDFMIEVEHLSQKDAIRKTLELAGYGETIREVRGKCSKENHAKDIIALDVDNHEPAPVVPPLNSPDFTTLILKTHSLVSETDYYFNRGLTVKTVEQYKLGYHQDGFNFAIKESEMVEEKENDLMRAYKYFLPVWDTDGVCRYFITRVDEEAVPSWAKSHGKTHNPKGLNVRLFNERYLRGFKIKGDFIFITEGIFDALSLEEFDFSSIALNSANNDRLLVKILSNAPESLKSKTFVLIPHNDKDGQELRLRLQEVLKNLGYRFEVFTLPNEYKDFNELLVASREGAKNFIQRSLNILQHNDFANDYLDDFRKGIVLEQDKMVMRTGFKGLDKKLGGGLYPGLYLIGAISSLGKTTFVLQIADTVALNGDDVLYFSLEMSRKDLISRSLSRNLFTTDSKNRFSAREIRQGKCPMELLDIGLESYKELGRNLAFVEGNFDIGVKEIRERVERNMRVRGKKPLVIVDYFQLLKPINSRMIEKQAVDYNVSELKRISRDYDIPIIAISSFNRTNYYSAIGYESLKESGNLEYSADVVLGIQLSGIVDVSRAKTDTDKRDLVNKLKIQDPREIEVVIIKQRDGLAYGAGNFKYYAKVNFFQEVS